MTICCEDNCEGQSQQNLVSLRRLCDSSKEFYEGDGFPVRGRNMTHVHEGWFIQYNTLASREILEVCWSFDLFNEHKARFPIKLRVVQALR